MRSNGPELRASAQPTKSLRGESRNIPTTRSGKVVVAVPATTGTGEAKGMSDSRLTAARWWQFPPRAPPPGTAPASPTPTHLFASKSSAAALSAVTLVLIVGSGRGAHSGL